MMAKPMKSLELHYPMIQFLIIKDIQYCTSFLDRNPVGVLSSALMMLFNSRNWNKNTQIETKISTICNCLISYREGLGTSL